MKSSHQRSSYRLLGLVGNGQFGRVYCGVHRKTGQLVAIKYLHRHSLTTHAFLRELHCLLSLSHANIVACHALEHRADGRQLVLEYCAGGTLRSHMLSPLSLTDILTLISDVLRGLAHAHQQGIVHCDIKPENILLSYSDGHWRAKISDFGIAKLIQERTKGTGQTGSPAYMAPERFYGQYSPASDVYAVGVMLFELLMGQRPFTGAPTALQSAHLNQSVPDVDQLGRLGTIVLKSLEKLSARRYPTAAEMLADLQLCQPNTLKISLPANQPSIAYQPCVATDCTLLTQPVRHFVRLVTVAPSSGERVLSAYGAQLAIWHQQSWQITQQVLDGPIQGLYPTPTGLIVSTEKTLWSGPDFELLTPLIEWSKPSIIVVEPRQRWAVAVNPHAKQLTIIHLCQSHRLADPLRYPLAPELQMHQLLAIDSGHFAIVGRTERPETQLQLWNRRGSYLTSLKLGLTLGPLTPTRQPHQWMAVDVHAPQTVIFLCLKPWRMSRITLDLCPTLMLELPWGYFFSDQHGRIQLFDRDLYPIGGIQGPGPMTAVIPLSAHELLLATWPVEQSERSANVGALWRMDLQTFDLDMIF